MLLIFLLASAFVHSVTANLLPISVNPARQRLVDSLGREVFFHGTNVVAKSFPWHPEIEGFSDGTFSEQDMKLLQSLGLNVVRLGFMWPGLEPTRGKYNDTYMQVMQRIVSLSAKYGIYVLLDMHQDVFSRMLCVEGLPTWAVNTGNAKGFPEPLHEPFVLDPKTGMPSDEDCAKFVWSDYYETEATSVAFQSLYNNTDGLLDSWAAFWAKTASAFKSFSNVIGYELINEPWPGDIYANPLLLVPNVADKMNLAPAYEVLSKAIRQHDEEHCIFFEGITWDDFGVGFNAVPGGEVYRNRSVLSYHYYIPPSLALNENFEARKKDLERLKCGGMMTEFQANGRDIEPMFKTMDAADRYLQSWIGWNYKAYHPSRPNLKGNKCCALWNGTGLDQVYVQNTTRSYPQAVAGYTVKFSFDVSSKEFVLVYEVSETCHATESMVYLNEEVHYPSGYTVTVTPSSVKWYSTTKNMLTFNHPTSLPVGSIVAITINKK
ncbi:endoglycoceramidase-like [Stylophora pistillata]|uniref:Endoglycoceramidase n=1 Tax=Stylophora pistillata TaxID=50429 RepID=A0A2B4S824_STYPI|nr:endoglycoceramidase-like [Stylophora pistillata]PFX24960.1 Endoglycoceramidase [Stylophora pistillata]